MNLDNETWLIKNGVLLEYRGNSEDIIIPDGVTQIAPSVFSTSNISVEIKSVKFPESLSIINDYAFQNCKIKNIDFPSNLEYIGKLAFAGNNISYIKIPPSVRVIDEGAFNDNIQAVFIIQSKKIKINGDLISSTRMNKFSNVYLPASVVATLSKDEIDNFYMASIYIDCDGATEREVKKAVEYFSYTQYYTKDIVLQNFNFAFDIRECIDNYKSLTDSSDYEGSLRTLVIESKRDSKYGVARFFVNNFAKDTDRKIALSSYQGPTDCVVLPATVDLIKRNALRQLGIKKLILSPNISYIYNDSLSGNEITSLELPQAVDYVGTSTFSGIPLKELIIDGTPTIEIGALNTKQDLDVYMKPSTYFRSDNSLEVLSIPKVTFHIDCSNIKNVQELEDCIANIADKYTNCLVEYNYPGRLLYIKLSTKYRSISFKCVNEIKKFETPVEDISYSANITYFKPNSNPEVQKRLDRIKELITPLDDTEEYTIKKQIDDLLDDYEQKKIDIKPRYNKSDFDINLQVGPTTLNDLNNSLIMSLDARINLLLASSEYMGYLELIEKWRNILESKNLTNSKHNYSDDRSFEESLAIIEYCIKTYNNEAMKDRILTLFSDISLKMSQELRRRFSDTVTLRVDTVDYAKELKNEVFKISSECITYQWLKTCLSGSGKGPLAISYKNICDIISLLDEAKKESYTLMLQDAVSKVLELDLSLTQEEIINKIDELFKPIREGLDKEAYYSIKLKDMINSINTGKQQLQGTGVDIAFNDIINATIKEILDKTPIEIKNDINNELKLVLDEWGRRLAVGDVEIAEGFKNDNNYMLKIMKNIEMSKRLIQGEQVTINEDDIILRTVLSILSSVNNNSENRQQVITDLKQMLDRWYEKLASGFVIVDNYNGDNKQLALTAVYLTILKDFYHIKVKLEMYLKEKNMYEQEKQAFSK